MGLLGSHGPLFPWVPIIFLTTRTRRDSRRASALMQIGQAVAAQTEQLYMGHSEQLYRTLVAERAGQPLYRLSLLGTRRGRCLSTSLLGGLKVHECMGAAPSLLLSGH